MAIARISLTGISASQPSAQFAISGTVVAGDVVCQVSGSDKTVKRADADDATARPPIGVVQSVSGSTAIVALNAEVASSLSGLSRGSAYWLSTTPGQLVASKPGTNAFPVGIAVSATELRVDTVAADLAATGGSGTVSSAGITSSDLTISGSPVTTSGTIDLALNTVPISKGGTGQTSKTAAFNALSPLTTAGDLIVFDGSDNVRLAVDGTKYLIADSAASTGVSYQTAGTVSSFGLTASNSALTITGSPITSSGTINVALNTITVAQGGTGLTSTAGEGSVLLASAVTTAVSQAISLSWRNKVINGAMGVAQRGGAATTTDGSYVADRWVLRNTTSATGSMSRGLSGSQATGAAYILQFATTTGASATAAQLAGLRQNIEGTTIADLAWGTASAKTVTLSFWAYASATGTYCIRLTNSATNRSYVAEYTISVSNTYEKKTITIPGDTSGTWLTTTGIGVQVWFDMGSGSDFQTTAGSWQAGNYSRTANQVNVIGTNSGTLRITAVQLEIGSVATPFENRPIETETELCQRYYQRFSALTGTLAAFGSGVSTTTTNAFVYVKYAQPMRSTPTLSQSGTAIYNTASRTLSAISASYYGDNSLGVNLTTSAGTQTIGQGVIWSATSTSSYIALDAEL